MPFYFAPPTFFIVCEILRASNMTGFYHKNIFTFNNRCLWRILKVCWIDCISNASYGDMQTRKNHSKATTRKWNWIGHCLRREEFNIAKRALDWNPQGSKRRSYPRTKWQRKVEQEVQRARKSWSEVKQLAQNGKRWRKFIEALSST